MSSTPDDKRALEDEWIAVRCQLGERHAFDELIRRWQEPIWTFVRRQVADSDVAKDITQEVWIRVLRGFGSLRDCSKLRAWLFTVARRTVMDRLRRQYAAPAIADVDMEDVPAEESAEDIEEHLATMHHELAMLPVAERETLTLFYLRELSMQELADVLMVPVGTVKSRLFRARKLLRLKLKPEGERS